jgi:hypothetical protein
MNPGTEQELFTLWYDNQFGKPVNELSGEEIKVLKDTYSFQLFVAGTRFNDCLKEIGTIIFRHRQN